MGPLQAAMARIAEWEARLALLEKPPKTPGNSSLPPSKGQKTKQAATGKKPPRMSRPDFGRALDPDPDRIVESRSDASRSVSCNSPSSMACLTTTALAANRFAPIARNICNWSGLMLSGSFLANP